MKFKKPVPIILAALALSAALIGCSGGATSSGSQTTDSSVTATTNASPEDIAAKIKESVTLTDMQPLSESDISSMYGIDLMMLLHLPEKLIQPVCVPTNF